MDSMVPKIPNGLKGEDITIFWDRYETGGVESATDWLRAATGSVSALEGDVKSLINEAKERNINIITFLKELDDHLLVESKDNDTNGTPDDGRELRDVSCDVNGSSENETESTEARHDDSGTNGTEQSG